MNALSPRVVVAGLIGGFVGNGVLGILFSSTPVQRILYDPALQGRLFLEVTPQRNIPESVAGLVVLRVIHGWVFAIVEPAAPGKTWID